MTTGTRHPLTPQRFPRRRSWSLIGALLLGVIAPREAGSFEPPRYEIKADIDVPGQKITSEQNVVFTNNSEDELRQVFFHIYPNRRYSQKEKKFMMRFAGYFGVNPFPGGFPEDGMRVQSVRVDGQDADFTVEGEDQTLLSVTLSRPLAPGASVTFEMSFEVRIPEAYSRFGRIEDIIKASRWYPILAVYTKNGWNKNPFYPYHRPFYSDAALYEVALTVPQDQVVIHSGVLMEETAGSDGRKTLTIHSRLPIREFTFAMSTHYRLVEDDSLGFKIKSYYLPGDEERGRFALDIAKKAMAYFSKTYGPYPYEVFSIAPVHLGYGGEQMANMVFIDTRVYKLPGFLNRYFDYLVAHETGHQWIFNLVGVNEYSQMWLEEGVNSFMTMEYIYDKYGPDAQVIEYPAWMDGGQWVLPRMEFRRVRDFRYLMLVRRGFDQSIVRDLSGFQEPSSIFALAYGKGLNVVAMLKSLLGQDAFDRVWKKIYEEYRFRNLSVDEFRKVCEEVSGEDLGWFFEEWLYSSGKLDVAVRRGRGHSFLLENRGTARMPVDVKVSYADGRQETFLATRESQEEPKELAVNGDVRRVVLDPERKLLDIDRTNNVWPRQLKVMPVPYYFPLYDLPLFLPEDSYNVVFGPEFANSGLGLKASWQKPYDQIFYTGSDYEFGEQHHHSRVGYQLQNLFQSPATLGLEISNTTDYDDGQDDLVRGKLSLRRELWPAKYGLMDMNDHVSLYLVRQQSVNDGADLLSGREDIRNLDYGRRDEAIVGASLHLNRAGPYPDPRQGVRVTTFAENAGHFLSATQSFSRSGIDLSCYFPATMRSQLAWRIKYGWGYPDDKNLYVAGGPDGLRGYDRKTLRGANILLGALEYRFPIVDGINIYLGDRLLGLESLQGVCFIEAGQPWYDRFSDGRFRKDAGLGLRMNLNIAGFVERLMIRADVARAINDSGEDTRFWFGINHAF